MHGLYSWGVPRAHTQFGGYCFRVSERHIGAAYRRGGKLAEAKFWYGKMWYNKIVPHFAWYLRTGAICLAVVVAWDHKQGPVHLKHGCNTFLPLSDLCTFSLHSKVLRV